MKRFALSFAAAAAFACEDASPLGTAHPMAELGATAIDFGKIPEGETAERSLELKNNGQVKLAVTLALDSAGSRDFSIEGSGLTVDATSIAQLTVRYTPVGFGSDEGTLKITTDDPEHPLLEARLTGGPIAPDVRAQPDPVDFGPAGEENQIARPISIENIGDANLHLSEILIDPEANNDFTLRSFVVPEKLIPGGEFELTIDYLRTNRGTPGRLLIRSDDPDTAELAVRLLPDPFRACQDGTDNDGDRLVDYPDDPGCTSANDDDEDNPPECDEGATGECGSEIGECAFGTRTCTNRIWGPCMNDVRPTAELCDGLDNDCDNRRDEGISESCEINSCAGARACVESSDVPGGEWSACLAISPVPELCDGLDNDCNGSIDEGIVETCMENNCTGTRICVPGGAGEFTACQVTSAPEVCDGADNDCNGIEDDNIADLSCGAGACARTAIGCNAGVPGTCTPGQPGTEICNNADDDCDGTPDNNIPNLTCGTGACLRSVAGCSGPCTPGAPSLELCNTLDDDCDGTPDNNIPNITCGTGICFRSVTACNSGIPNTCVPGPATTEVCNNLDDNCDGIADNGIPNLTCGTGACFRSVNACNAGMPNTCSPGAPTGEVCNNIDDNCDGVADNGIPNLTCGTGACFRSVAACNSGIPNTCSPGAPSNEVCNGLDDNCDGVADNGIPNLTCGTGACARSVSACNAGVPNTCSPGAPSAELCDGVDNDCNGVVDNGACAVCGLMSTGADPQEPNNAPNSSNPAVPPGAIGAHVYEYDLTLTPGDVDWIQFNFPAAGSGSFAQLSASITCVSWAAAGCGSGTPAVGLEAWYYDAFSTQLDGANNGLTGLATVSSAGQIDPFGIFAPQRFRVRAFPSTTVCAGEAINAHLSVRVTWSP